MAWQTYTAQGQLKELSAASPLAPMIPISDTVLGSAQASITVNLPSAYQHLKIIVSGRGDNAATSTVFGLRFNSDSGANYDSNYGIQNATTLATTEVLAGTFISLGKLTSSTGPANQPGGMEINIPDYAGTTFSKVAYATGYYSDNTTTTNIHPNFGGGVWKNTAAITSISVFFNVGNMAAGTRVTVYGIGVTNPNGIGVGAFTPPTYSTTLPGSPADGQQAILVDSTTTPTYQWLFRYNAGSSNTDKWEYIGGVPAIAETTTSETTTSTSYANLSGGATGPSFTVPRAGIYVVETGFNADTSAAIIQTMSYDIGGTGAVDADYVRTGLDAGTANRTSVARAHKQASLAASTTLLAKYKVSSSTGTFTNRWMRVTPIRVS